MREFKELEQIVFTPEIALPRDWSVKSQLFGRTVTVLKPPPKAFGELKTIIRDATIHLIDAKRIDLEALDFAISSETILFPDKLRCALGLPTTDLIRLLRIQGTDIIRFTVAGHLTVRKHATLEGPTHFNGRELASDRLPRTNDSGPHDNDTPISSSLSAMLANSARTHSTHRKELDLPHVAIITNISSSPETIIPFLDAVSRQNYPGRITVVIAEDHVPGAASVAINTAIRSTINRKRPAMEIKIIKNADNLGNCLSRNAAIEACDADIYAFVNVDCLMNGDFLRAHVVEHLLSNPDAVIGPCNIETDGENGALMLQRLESRNSEIVPTGNPQDPFLSTAYVNTNSQNLSISKRWIQRHGAFDPAFAYSSKPDSRHCWEDVDIGARIYATGGVIRFTSRAFSLHQPHRAASDEGRQVRESAKNFLHLVAKHPCIQTVSRRWFVDTADRIVNWAEVVNATSPEINALHKMIEVPKARIAPLLPYLRRQKRSYRILTHKWHVPHQYEIYKLPFDFVLATETGTHLTNEWDFQSRPLPSNVCLLPWKEIRQSDFDLAILHFDENVLCTQFSNGMLSTDWGDTFRWFLENVKLPTIAVCHGTVPFVGQYGANPQPIEKFQLYEAEADRLRDLLSDITVVVNSHEAAREWKFARMKVIWHGYDPQEFQCGTHDLDVISHGIDRARPHYRGAHQLADVLSRLDPTLSISTHKHERDVPVATSDPRFAEFSFKRWLSHLGRHKIYLNTTLRSPMPRSRTEAMLCGVIPASLDNHDVALFIKPGVNGFCSSSTEELADFCNSVCKNDSLREKLSVAARNTAVDQFNHDRFLTEWVRLIEDALEAPLPG